MLSANGLNLITGLISFLLTLMVLSYLVGDNPLFRIAIYLFVGVAAGYAATIAWQQVLWPHLLKPLLVGSSQERLLAAVPLLLGFLLFTKLSPRAARLGNPSMAFLVGTAAAVAIGGALFGTLIPQTQAVINLFDLQQGGSLLERLFEGSLLLVGTVSSLAYFHFSAKKTREGIQRNPLLNAVAWLGSIFIAITFGVLLAGVYAAALTALIERLYSLWIFLDTFF